MTVEAIESKSCPACKRAVLPGNLRCPHCKHPQVTMCDRCLIEIQPTGTKYCPKCGQRAHQPKAPIPQWALILITLALSGAFVGMCVAASGHP